MTFARPITRVAAGGAAAALIGAAFVGASAPANAAPVSTVYNCSAAGSTFPVSVSVDIALLPTTAKAGFPVAAGLFSFTTTVAIPDAVQTVLDGPGVNGAKSADFGADFGGTVAKATTAWTKPAASTGGFWVYTGKGANVAFTLPKQGSYTVSMPKTFTLEATKDGATVIPATCTAAATPTAIGNIALAPQTAKLKLSGPKAAKAGKKLTYTVKISNEFSKTGGEAVTGTVTLKDGKKKVGTGTIKNGKAKIKVTKGLSAGKHTLVASYAGDDFTDKGASKAKTVTVTK